MLVLSDRCHLLREQAVNQKPLNEFLCSQRAYYFALGMASLAAAEADNAWLTAAGLASVILSFPTVIQNGELIVGHNFADGARENLSSDQAEAASQLKCGGFSEEQINWYLSEGLAAERRRTIQPGRLFRGRKAAELNEEAASIGFCLTDNHTVIGYENVLRYGFAGLMDQINQAENHCRDHSAASFYGPIRHVCQAACRLGERYADKAQAMLAQGIVDEKRRSELQEIAAVCRRVPRHPARNFHEAVQSLWFAHMINTWEDGINANSLGRLDQILFPYYEADIARGRLTREEAFEIICCLWIKLYRDYDVQQSCIGGSDAEGRAAVNDLSWLMLDVTEALDFVRCLSVRYSPDTDRQFLRRALEVVGHVQKGIPFFFNDAVLIPALISQQIEPEDAADYTQIGCVETVIPGKSNPHAVTTHCNMLKAVEYALADGHSMIKPYLFPGLETGDPLQMTAFSQLKDAVFSQLRHIIEQACLMTADSIEAAAFNAPKPYKSLLTSDCLAKGRDFNNRGARYDYYQVMLFGLPNLADSLAAVEKRVFREQRISMADLLYQLRSNFPDEAIRLDLQYKAPKFGNDLAEVDQLAAECLDFACDVLQDMSFRTGLSFHAQPFSFLWMVDRGRLTAATPDGRRCGEILAYSVSPMQGRDENGFTALINSLCSLPTLRTAGTTSAIVEIDPQLFSERNLDHLVSVMLAGATQGISNLQFNVIDAAVLQDAQKYPDRHRNLAVRVSGFSQKFALLDKPIQDHIIQRTKHKVL